MATSEEFKEWDEIFKQRKEYLEENPEARDRERPKTFEDDEGDTRCTKCGSTNDIGGCIECVSENAFLEEQGL